MYHHTRKRSADSSEPHFDDKGLAEWLTHDQEFQWPNPPGYNHNRFTKWLKRGGRGVREFDFVTSTHGFGPYGPPPNPPSAGSWVPGTLAESEIDFV